jgi:sulfate permease
MVFLGAILAGKATATKLINSNLLDYKLVSIIIFSVSISLLVANLSGIPQSTSQSTVLALVVPATYFHDFNSHMLFFEVIPTWFILPLISFVICFLIGKYIYKPIRKRGYTISKKLNENPILKGIIILMSLYVAFSIGSNNVANAAGPIASMTINELNLPMEKNFILVLIISTLIVAPSFGIGSSLFGHKIVRKTGPGKCRSNNRNRSG